MKRLEGKVALVTGAGRQKGIGYACAARLAREGAGVALADLGSRSAGSNELPLNAAQLGGMGARALAVEADVTDPASVQAMVKEVLEKLGRIDILVNNAGGIFEPAPLAQTDLEAWSKTLAVNLTGTMLCSKEVVPVMIGHGGGKIINMSSRAAHRGAIWMHAYCAAKAGILGLTRSMALELAPFQICVNAVCPGDIDTELKRWGWEKEALVTGKTVEEIAGEAARGTPLGRIGTPEDVAAAVAFFASPDADYLTGEMVNITGGNGMRPIL